MKIAMIACFLVEGGDIRFAIKKLISQYDLEGAAEALRPVIEQFGEPGNQDE